MPDILNGCQAIRDALDQTIADHNALLDAVRSGDIIDSPATRTQLKRLMDKIRKEQEDLQQCAVNSRPYAISLDGIEVTQSVQDMRHTVPLLAGKRTIVRAYLSCQATSPMTVRGGLMYVIYPQGYSGVIPSLNHVVLDPADAGHLAVKRNDISKSLNFELPATLPINQVLCMSLVTLVDVTTNSTISTDYLDPAQNYVRVIFEDTPPLRLRVLNIRYSTQTSGPFVAPDFDLRMIKSWLNRAYPVATVEFSSIIVNSNYTSPFTSTQINSQVAAIRTFDLAFDGIDPRTHYYGLVTEAGGFMQGSAAIPPRPDPHAVGSGPTGPDNYGWDFDGCFGDWMAGHELGHNFGRDHPGFPVGQDRADSNYPFANGQLANDDCGYAGLDVGDPALSLPMTALPGTLWHDVMTYCLKQWLSSYTYIAIRDSLIAENAPALNAAGMPDRRFPRNDALPSSPASRPMVHIVALVNISRYSGQLEYLTYYPTGNARGGASSSIATIRFARRSGAVLAEYAVLVQPYECKPPDEDQTGLVDVMLPFSPDADIIELTVAGRVADSRHRSATPPQLRQISQRSPGEKGQLTVEWQTTNNTEENYTYTVQVSTDNGRTWFTIAVGVREPMLSIDQDQFHNQGHFLLRVLATDGFSSSLITMDPLRFD